MLVIKVSRATDCNVQRSCLSVLFEAMGKYCLFKQCVCLGRKQCIELEQQFDFLKDLVAAVPDMQGEGEDNHAEGGEKVARR